jgi:hypothetical protein
MGELREIVDIAAVERLFLLLAVLGPIAGLVIGAALGKRSQRLCPCALVGLLLGLLGTLNWLLWRTYNVLTDANGMDSVKGLAINLALFIAVGALLGLGYHVWLRRAAADPVSDEMPVDETPQAAD